jgi:hypothetical protein
VSTKARKRVNAACRAGTTAHQQYGRSRPRVPRFLRRPSVLALALLNGVVGPAWDEDGNKIESSRRPSSPSLAAGTPGENGGAK